MRHSEVIYYSSITVRILHNRITVKWSSKLFSPESLVTCRNRIDDLTLCGESGDGRGGLNIDEFKSYYRKGGWLEINGYKWNVYRGIKSAINKGYAVIKYSGDAGVVVGENSHYAIAVLTITKTKWPWQKFNLKKLSKRIHDLMEG